MSKTSHIHVRSLEVGDFTFIQDLALRQPHFTVPPTYVLWLMLRIKGAICLVAENSEKGPLAYLLAVPLEGSDESIFVWQLAASQEGQRERATLAILIEFRHVLAKLAVSSIVFSAVPKSNAYRMIRRYAWKVFSSLPTALNALPFSVDRTESEFVLSLGRAPRFPNVRAGISD